MNLLDPARIGRFAIGFDRFWDELDALSNRNVGYPPYNIQKLEDNKFRISLAVAGFDKKEIVITNQNSELVVSGKRLPDNEDVSFIFKGIANRNFQLSWKLADHVEVDGAKMENGLLHIDLFRHVPQEMLPKQIDIQ